MQLLFLQQWFSNEILKAIGWTLIHSLWQGLLAAVLAAVIIVCTRKSAARVRYNLLGAVLVLFVLASVITFLQQLSATVVAGNSVAAGLITVNENLVAADGAAALPIPAGGTIQLFINYFNANASLFVFIWGIFFLLHCIKLMTGLAGVQRMRNYHTYAAPQEWGTKLISLSARVGVTQTVQLLQSELVKVPVAIGFFKPVILIPLGLLSQLPPEQVETVLLHELAHIRRKDYAVNIVQRVAEAVFFFNPALVWISSLVRQEREACCDDIVVTNTNHKGSYLEALVSFQEYSLSTRGYAMAIGSKRHYLLNRVKRMITRENKKLDLMEKLLLIIGLIVVSAFTFIPKKQGVKNDERSSIVPVKDLITQKPAPALTVSKSPSPHKPVVKKQAGQPVLAMSYDIPPADTVPSSKKETDKKAVNSPAFPNMSCIVNDDGTTKTETITVTDRDGKKYSYTKLNNKVTSLNIDGKPIPENEISNYDAVFEKVETARQENKIGRLLDIAKRTGDMKSRAVENRLQMEARTTQKRALAEQDRLMQSVFDLNRLKESSLQRNMKSKLLRDIKYRSTEKKDIQRLFKKIQEERNSVPTINGREVVKDGTNTGNVFAGDDNSAISINAPAPPKHKTLSKLNGTLQQTDAMDKFDYASDAGKELKGSLQPGSLNALEIKRSTPSRKKQLTVQPVLRSPLPKFKSDRPAQVTT